MATTTTHPVRQQQPEVTRSPTGARRTAALVLSWLTLVAMAASSVAGLLVHDVYGDPASTAAMLRGYDLVTLLLAVPLLTWALLALGSGSVVARLVWVGVLAYAVYDYALYLFATGLNDLFLLHVVAFGSAVFALPLALVTVQPETAAHPLPPRAPVRTIAAVLGVLAVALGAMWVVAALQYAVDGTMPAGSALVESDAVVHVGMTLDLALLVPAYAVAAVLLWRRTDWGALLAAAVLVSGTLHQAGYLVALPFQAAAEVPGAQAFDAAEVPIAAAFLLATVVLLRASRAVPAVAVTAVAE